MEPISLHQFWLHLEWSYELIPVAVNICDMWVAVLLIFFFSSSETSLAYKFTSDANEEIISSLVFVTIHLGSSPISLEADLLNFENFTLGCLIILLCSWIWHICPHDFRTSHCILQLNFWHKVVKLKGYSPIFPASFLYMCIKCYIDWTINSIN